jgi:hypothetical protein
MAIWRVVVFVALMVVVGVSIVKGQTITISEPGPMVLPKFVQTLPPEKFEAWALWQNQTAASHLKAGYEPQYLSGEGSRTGVNTQVVGPRGRHNGSANANFSGLTISESFPTSYVNNFYSGPGPLTVLNPYCRNTDSGVVDWSKIYVIVDNKVMTMTQAIEKHGPGSPEVLFQNLMAPYFR